jgi:hypothetical protein
MSSYSRKAPSAVVRCPHHDCNWFRIRFYSETAGGLGKAEAYTKLWRMWIRHFDKVHKEKHG